MADELNWLSAADLGKGYRKKKFSPVDVAKACLKQIAKHDPKLNAMCLVDEEQTLKQAKASEKRWAEGQALGPARWRAGADQGPAARQRLADLARLEDGRSQSDLESGCAVGGAPARGGCGLPRSHHDAGIRLEGRH